jgi:hypothetical protein
MVGKHLSFLMLNSLVVKDKPDHIHGNHEIVPAVVYTQLHFFDFVVGFLAVVDVQIDQCCG